ncbi:MAG: DNRLRE domain-containing protein [Sporichthyaceae bacterium]
MTTERGVPRGIRTRHARRFAIAAALVLGSLAVLQAPVAQADAPDEPAPAATSESHREAARTGKPVEIVDVRDAYSSTFANPDGTTTVETSESPVHVNKSGEWLDIDSTLEASGGVLKPAATDAAVVVSDGLGDDSSEPLAKVKSGSASLALDWAGNLPPAQVDGSLAVFDIPGPQKVRVGANDDGFSVHMVLDAVPASAPVYRFPITAKGVRLERTESGQFVAKNAAGEPVFWIAPPVAWDHTQDGLEAGPEQTVPVAAKRVDENGRQVLELRPDFEWLTDSARVLPITIDPEVKIDNSERTTYVMSSTPSRGYPSDSRMRVGRNTASSPAYGTSRSYLEFEELGNQTLGRVSSAELELYQYDALSCTPTTMNVYPVLENWHAQDHTSYDPGPENGVWWLGQGTNLNHRQPRSSYQPDPNKDPGITPGLYKASASFAHGVDGVCGNASQKINVTAMVEAWVKKTRGQSGGLQNYGMVLRASESDETAYKAFCSRNVNTSTSATSCYLNERRPTLRITYNQAVPTVPAADMSVANPSLGCTGGTTPLLNLTPTLRAIVRDLDPSDAQANTKFDVEVYANGVATPVATGTSAAVKQGTVGAWTVPAATLLPETSYKWRVRGVDEIGDKGAWSGYCTFATGVVNDLVQCTMVLGPQDLECVSARATPTVMRNLPENMGLAAALNSQVVQGIVPPANQVLDICFGFVADANPSRFVRCGEITWLISTYTQRNGVKTPDGTATYRHRTAVVTHIDTAAPKWRLVSRLDFLNGTGTLASGLNGTYQVGCEGSQGLCTNDDDGDGDISISPTKVFQGEWVQSAANLTLQQMITRFDRLLGMTIKWNLPKGVQKTADDPWVNGLRMRCDNIPMDSAYNPGQRPATSGATACVNPQGPSSVTYNSVTNPLVREVAEHVYQAQGSGGLPSRWGHPRYNQDGLSRSQDEQIHNQNRAIACPSGTYTAPTECDEFALASSYQGASFVASNDWSRAPVPEAANRSQGGSMSRLYLDMHIVDPMVYLNGAIDEDRYWIEAILPDGRSSWDQR